MSPATTRGHRLSGGRCAADSSRRFAFAAAVILALTGPFTADVFASETPTIRALDSEQIALIVGGDTIRELGRGTPLRAEVIGAIEAPISELAPILTDYPNIPLWAPATRDVVVVDRDGDTAIIEGMTQVPWPISNRTWQMRSRARFQRLEGHDAFVYTFNHVPGTGNINTSFGFWVLYPLPGHPSYTYVRYVVNADPGIAIPGAILRWVMRSALPDLISGLRDRHAELNGA